MNPVDLIIAFLIFASIKRGLHEGITRIFSYLGGIGGILLGAWVAPPLVAPVTGQLNRLLLIIMIEVTLAVIFSSVLKLAADKLEPHIHRFKIRPLAKTLGVCFEVLLTLILVWLAASLFSNVRSQGIGREIRQSAIISSLNRLLPPVPDVFARIEKAINLNGFPEVFIGQEPQRGTVIVNGTVDRAKIDASTRSVVKIFGFGCGGIVEGSGFVSNPGIVVTNAHVVAGVARPKVQDTNGTYTAIPLLVNKDFDIAVLRADGLKQPPIPLNQSLLDTADPVVAAGYPGGGPLTLSGGAIIDENRAVGRDIYNRGLVTREIYEFQADVESGNSGGPLFDADGQVAGLVFAKSVTQPNVGYAILIRQVAPDIQRAQQNQTPVSTGRCAAG